MKKIFITTFIIAFIFAINQNATCQTIIGGNCIDMSVDVNGPCLQPRQSGNDLVTVVKVTVDLYYYNYLVNTNWYVNFYEVDGKITKLVKSEFYHEGSHKFVAWHTIKLTPGPGAISHNFVINFLTANGATLSSFQPTGGFHYCQNNNRLLNSNFELDDYKIFPNPIVEDFTVEYNAIQNEELSFEIFDIKGRSIYTSQFRHKVDGFYSKQVNNLNLQKGVYFCRIKTDNSQKTIKITKL